MKVLPEFINVLESWGMARESHSPHQQTAAKSSVLSPNHRARFRAVRFYVAICGPKVGSVLGFGELLEGKKDCDPAPTGDIGAVGACDGWIAAAKCGADLQAQIYALPHISDLARSCRRKPTCLFLPPLSFNAVLRLAEQGQTLKMIQWVGRHLLYCTHTYLAGHHHHHAGDKQTIPLLYFRMYRFWQDSRSTVVQGIIS